MEISIQMEVFVWKRYVWLAPVDPTDSTKMKRPLLQISTIGEPHVSLQTTMAANLILLCATIPTAKAFTKASWLSKPRRC